MWVCVLVSRNPVVYFSLLFYFSPFAATAAVSCLDHIVPQALKISTLWQPRSVAQQVFLCGSRLIHYACVDLAYTYVRVGVCVGVYGSVDLFVCWHAGTPHRYT